MKTSITKGLSGDKLIEIKREFVASAILRARIVTLLEEKIRSENRDVRSKDLYENPSWAFRQADSRGYERALQEVISLLSVTE